MLVTLAEVKILIEAVGALEMEHGERPERSALLAKLEEYRAALRAEIESARW